MPLIRHMQGKSHNGPGNMRQRVLPSSSESGRTYRPGLYPQVSNVFNFAHNATWYAVSAYMDLRAQVYGQLPAIAIVAAGPVKEVAAGRKWRARLYIMSTGAVVTDLDCGLTKYEPANQHSSKHAAATVFCRTSALEWQTIKSTSEELGVCMLRDHRAFCDVASIVPVGIPPRYPKFPLSWADHYIEDADHAPSTAEIQRRSDHLAGKGRIAMCVPGVRGDHNVHSLRFYLEYYRKLGVHTANMYMHSPGSKFARSVEAIVSAQKTKIAATDVPRLVLWPWCVQLGASYGCRPGQPVAPLPGYFDFVGTNHGQLLASQDCLFRSIGVSRWVLFVDLDEYVVPNIAAPFALHDLARESALRNKGVAAAQLIIRSAFYENCLPSLSSDNASVPLLPSVDTSTLTDWPRPAWAAARVSKVYPARVRSKYMCNPLDCDRVGVHYQRSTVRDRPEFTGQSPYWPASNKTDSIDESVAMIHHVRVRDRFGQVAAPACRAVAGLHEEDWGMTNFVMGVLGFARPGLAVRQQAHNLSA